MSGKRTLRDSRLKPNMVEPIADSIDGHSGTVIINTAEHKVNLFVVQTTMLYPIFDVIVSILSGDVHIIGLNDYFWVDGR